MVELVPRRGRDERQHQRLVITVMTAAAGLAQRPAVGEHLVTFLDAELGQIVESRPLIVAPATAYPGRLDWRREGQHSNHEHEENVVRFHHLFPTTSGALQMES